LQFNYAPPDTVWVISDRLTDWGLTALSARTGYIVPSKSTLQSKYRS